MQIYQIQELIQNIEELFNDLYANLNRKKNKFDLKYNSLNSISGKNKLSSTTTTLIIPEEEKNKEKKNYPVLDLFFRIYVITE